MKKSGASVIIHQAIFAACKKILEEKPSYNLLVVMVAMATTYILLIGKRKDFTRFDSRIKRAQLIGAIENGSDILEFEESDYE